MNAQLTPQPLVMLPGAGCIPLPSAWAIVDRLEADAERLATVTGVSEALLADARFIRDAIRASLATPPAPPSWSVVVTRLEA